MSVPITGCKTARRRTPPMEMPPVGVRFRTADAQRGLIEARKALFEAPSLDLATLATAQRIVGVGQEYFTIREKENRK